MRSVRANTVASVMLIFSMMCCLLSTICYAVDGNSTEITTRVQTEPNDSFLGVLCAAT